MKTLKKHRAAIGYTLDDLKGISPTLRQHKIKLEEDAKPVIDHQRQLNPKMKEVVRKEILKLLGTVLKKMFLVLSDAICKIIKINPKMYL